MADGSWEYGVRFIGEPEIYDAGTSWHPEPFASEDEARRYATDLSINNAPTEVVRRWVPRRGDWEIV